MAKQTINQGTAPTGAGGDTFRSGSEKLQANDNELYDFIGGAANTTTLPAALPVAKGGTGATSAAAARTNLGLGTAATATLTTSATDSTNGRVLKIGDFGFGAKVGIPVKPHGDNTFPASGIYNTTSASGFSATGCVLTMSLGTADRGAEIFVQANQAPGSVPVMQFRAIHGSTYVGVGNQFGAVATVRHTGNTTVDANGFLKNASPIIQLFADKIELNDEAQQQEITFEKLGVGDYLVKGSTGFSQDGWYIETPKDANGNLLVAVVYEQLENGDISVKTYDYMLNNKGRIVADTETPLDIPETRWIDLRLQELPQPEMEVTDDTEQ